MNKKIVAVAAGIFLVASLVSCNRSGGSDTTTMPVLTGATESTLQVGQSTDTAAQTANANPTYILTTQQGQTMETVPLTGFSLDTTATTIAIPSDFTDPSLDNPSVVTVVITTLPTQATTSTVTTTKPTSTTTQPTTSEPTTAAEKVSKYVDIVSCGTDPNNGNFIITFDPSGWDGGVKNSTRFISVEIDGKTFPAKATVSGKPDADGNATIKVYTSELEPSDGCVITVSLPAGLVVSKNGNQMSTAFDSSVEHKTP